MFFQTWHQGLIQEMGDNSSSCSTQNALGRLQTPELQEYSAALCYLGLIWDWTRHSSPKKGNFSTPRSMCLKTVCKVKGLCHFCDIWDVLGGFPEFFCSWRQRCSVVGRTGRSFCSHLALHHQGVLRWGLVGLNFITGSIRISSPQKDVVY